jgi:large subunit ribosomal protein L10
MTRRIARAAGPCLRQLACERSIVRTRLANPVRGFSTASPQYATVAAVQNMASGLALPIERAPATKPPSARPVETRKSQLIRTYTSLLRSSPLMLFFQHSNLTAVEWAAVRRELKKALEAVPVSNTLTGIEEAKIAKHMQVQVLRTNMFKVALKIAEFHNPEAAAALASTPRTNHGPVVHDLSKAAYEATTSKDLPQDSAFSQLEPLMIGPMAALVLPALSTAHLAAALSILSPVPGKFPAPTRKKNPGYYDPTCQEGLSKILLVGGRIEGKIFDQAGVSWVGGIEGGLDGLRAQLVAILQGAGLGVTNALEGGSRSLWLALEGRKMQLEDESKPAEAEAKKEE